ncbi:NAD(+)--rifampin ADP-ribosyltransferase [Mucilaginibacter psychrotolerans]|uniref:NAD(+)--rifampin ADP-ribosyltransferase n=1 Tax=Mucilaginibacter psychrotolerans TaxID=1524096 RepID=UPI003744A4EE
MYHELALLPASRPADQGPFYHGTRADLRAGDLLTAGRMSNYQPDLVMNHIYFTALVYGAGLAAALARGNGGERVYIVEPTGDFEDDPNVTNKKFPGNPMRSYRTQYPLKVVGEVTDWLKQTPEQLQQWRKKLAAGKGEVISQIVCKQEIVSVRRISVPAWSFDRGPCGFSTVMYLHIRKSAKPNHPPQGSFAKSP